MKIIVLRGPSNCGKTTTILKLINWIENNKDKFESEKLWGRVESVNLIKVLGKNLLIGICSYGDHHKYLKKPFKCFIEEVVDLIICACKGWNTVTETYIKEFANQNNASIQWIDKSKSSPQNYDIDNEKYSKELIKKINDFLSNFSGGQDE